LSLEAELYTAALPVLDKPILYFPGGTQQPKPAYLCSLALPGHSYITYESGLTQKLRYQDILEYFIFSGTIYIALQQWEKALDALESAVTYPVRDTTVSKIMVEAYKKWVLVNILLHGKCGSLPSTTNSQAAKLFHAIAKPYDVVASLFESAPAARLYAEVQCGHEIWKEDRNTGLMMLVLASYQKFQIRNLANVYRTISISEVTSMTISAETGEILPSNQATETLVAHMISSDELYASIEHPANSSAVLTFSPTGPLLSEFEVQRQLALSLEQIKSMTDDIRYTDRRLTRDKEYLKWAYKNKKLGKNGRGDSITVDDMIWNPVEDEDLMGGSY
jgi:COP9 signalosome complex subunit 3